MGVRRMSDMTKMVQKVKPEVGTFVEVNHPQYGKYRAAVIRHLIANDDNIKVIVVTGPHQGTEVTLDWTNNRVKPIPEGLTEVELKNMIDLAMDNNDKESFLEYTNILLNTDPVDGIYPIRTVSEDDI
jgi:hypothetical protein